jgi:hypothetical protein
MGLMRLMRGNLATSLGGPFMAQLDTVFSGTRPQIIEERELLMRFRTRPHVSATDGPIDLDAGIVWVRAGAPLPDGSADDGQNVKMHRLGRKVDS